MTMDDNVKATSVAEECFAALPAANWASAPLLGSC